MGSDLPIRLAQSEKYRNEELTMEESADNNPREALRDKAIAVLKTIYDPEIPVDIYELGLVYGVDVNETNDIKITMTLTSPSCPVAETLPPEVEQKVAGIKGVNSAKVEITWEPPWEKSMMSEVAMVELGML
jgi:FeS assembly SUF system protein